MSLTTDDVKKIAHLARLHLSENDIEPMRQELSTILGMVEQMSSVNTDGVDPMAHSWDTTQPLRDDVVTETNQRDVFQKIAPRTQAGLYLVPPVLGNE